MVMVPCYNEGDKELRKTIDSVQNTSYPSSNKVLFVVADGNIKGKGETMSTPDYLRNILGFNISPSDRSYKCTSLGERTENRAKLYYGIRKDPHSTDKYMNYLVIVKCGLECEEGSGRAGNRGKRDSQLLLMGLLNRFHHGRRLNELDEAIKTALENLGMDLAEIKYLMAIDADTRVDRASICFMTRSMNHDQKQVALCGETKIDTDKDKPWGNWVTWIQQVSFLLYFVFRMLLAFPV